MPSSFSVNAIDIVLDHLKGGFAPLCILLREFHPDKTAIVLPGLHFTAYTLLLHMLHRQNNLLAALQNQDFTADLWPEAFWADVKLKPSSDKWNAAIEKFERENKAFCELVAIGLNYNKPEAKDFTFSCAIICLHHNAYHIGQLKALGRQLGVW